MPVPKFEKIDGDLRTQQFAGFRLKTALMMSSTNDVAKAGVRFVFICNGVR